MLHDAFHIVLNILLLACVMYGGLFYALIAD